LSILRVQNAGVDVPSLVAGDAGPWLHGAGFPTSIGNEILRLGDLALKEQPSMSNAEAELAMASCTAKLRTTWGKDFDKRMPY
jgi:hypothetical protein